MKKHSSKLLFLIAIIVMVLSSSTSGFAATNLSGYKISGYPKFPKVSQTYYIIYNEGNRNDRLEICFFNISGKSSDTYIYWNGGGVDIRNGWMINDVKYYLSQDGKWLKFEQGYGRCSDYASNILVSNLNVYNEDGKKVVKASPVNYIRFSKTKYKVDVGDQFSIKCKTNLKGKIAYKSSNKKIVSISSKAKIKALKSGFVTITATASNGMKAKCKVYVN